MYDVCLPPIIEENLVMRVPLASAGLREQDIESAIEVLRSGNLTMGAKVARFEQTMADYLEVKHFVMVNSGSSANLAMIEALLRPTKRKPFLNQVRCFPRVSRHHSSQRHYGLMLMKRGFHAMRLLLTLQEMPMLMKRQRIGL